MDEGFTPAKLVVFLAALIGVTLILIGLQGLQPTLKETCAAKDAAPADNQTSDTQFYRARLGEGAVRESGIESSEKPRHSPVR